jgi:hypothetical protein
VRGPRSAFRPLPSKAPAKQKPRARRSLLLQASAGLIALSSALPALAAPLAGPSPRRLAHSRNDPPPSLQTQSPPRWLSYLREPPGLALALGVHAAAGERSHGASISAGLQKWFNAHLGIGLGVEAGEVGMAYLFSGGWETHRRYALLKLEGLLNGPSTDLFVFDFGVGAGPASLKNPGQEPRVGASDFSYALTLGMTFRVVRLGYQSFFHRARACSREGCADLSGGGVVMLGLLVPIGL